MEQAVSRQGPKGENGGTQVAKGVCRRQYSIYIKTSREERVKAFSPLSHQ